MTNPVFIDAAAVIKGNARAYIPLRFGTAAAVRALDLSDSYLLFVVNQMYWRDTSDTTTADDGSVVIRDLASNCWKLGTQFTAGKRQAVRVATTANITIATALNNGDTLDGVTLATSDLVLVKDQTLTQDNGIYVVGASPARSTEFDTFDEHVGSLIAVSAGTVNANKLWFCTANYGGVLATTSIPFTRIAVG